MGSPVAFCDKCGSPLAISDDLRERDEKGLKLQCGQCGATVTLDASEPRVPAPEAPPLWVVSFADDDDRQLELDEVEAAIRAGEIHCDSLAWREGMADWKPLDQCPEFAATLAEAAGAERREAPVGDKPDAPLKPDSVRSEPGKPPVGQKRKPAKPLFDTKALSGLFEVELEPVALSSGTLQNEKRPIPARPRAPQVPKPPHPTATRPADDELLALDVQFVDASLRPPAGPRAPEPAPSTGLVLSPPSMRVLARPVAPAATPTATAAGAPPKVTSRTWWAVGLLAGAALLGLWAVLQRGATAPVASAVPPPPVTIVRQIVEPEPPKPVDQAPSPSADQTATPRPDQTMAATKTSKGQSPAGGSAQPSRPSSPASVAAKTPQAKAAAADSEGPAFDTAAAKAALEAAASSAAACRKGDDPTGTAVVLVTFAPSGRVTSATVNGKPFAGTPTGGCIASAMRRATVPPFAGQAITVSKRVPIR